LRNRLLLARNLLNESGSIFVQIGEQNIHHVREIMDEVFGGQNFVSMIAFVRGGAQTAKHLPSITDYLLWYSKDKSKIKFRPLLVRGGWAGRSQDKWIEYADGKRERWKEGEIPKGGRIFSHRLLESATGSETSRFPIEFQGSTFNPKRGWSTTKEGIERLKKSNRLLAIGNTLRFVVYLIDFDYSVLTNNWTDTFESGFASERLYAVQTYTKVVERCILMTTDPGDLIFDPTCGSGTAAWCAEKWGRRWITCDTSRVSITLAKQRLITAVFEYYDLARPDQGVAGGFNYLRVPRVTLRSITNVEPPEPVVLYDQPAVDRSRKRVTGPFTVEAVPSQRVRGLEDTQSAGIEADSSIARSGETIRQNEWVDELISAGIRGKNGQILKFVRVEVLSGTRWLNARAETGDGKAAVVSFGPEYSPLEQRQVELAIGEAQELVPKPKLVIFASFQFDPEAAKDIDELKWPGVDVLKVQMNTDLLTSDLKKKTASNESFWLVGQPDVEVRKAKTGYEVVVNGFDYYNTRSGELESGDASKIAVWELDTDYDGRSLYPRQVFFPLSGSEGGWTKLARNLRGLIDEDLLESYRGNQSLPFEPGDNGQIAVKIIDDRGIESLRIIRVGHDLHN
jgi:adenine-specific DNA-methyltransferase